jgi:hypothetical protein
VTGEGRLGRWVGDSRGGACERGVQQVAARERESGFGFMWLEHAHE